MKLEYKSLVSASLILGVFSCSFVQRSKLGLEFDPRGKQRVADIQEEEESAAFQKRLKDKRFNQYFWPGLKAAHLSFIWLQTLSGISNEASYNKDFSWLFSKLYTLAVSSHPKELYRVFKLSPFLYVIGQDLVGSTLLAFETIKRQPENWASWYWAGFHSLENLHHRKLAGDLYLESSKRAGSPYYVASLGIRLSAGLYANQDMSTHLDSVIQELPSEIVEKIKRSRPEYFKQ